MAMTARVYSGDWPQFRGPRGDGVDTESRIPTEWSPERHAAWKTKIPGSGWSQPVVLGNRIYVTTAVSDKPGRPKEYERGIVDPHTITGDQVPAPAITVRWNVLAVDLKSGAVVWEKTALAGKPKYPIHPSNTYASETPAADAQGVYAWFSAAGLVVAFDHRGALLWQRPLGVFRHQNHYGGGSSPRLYQGLLFLQCFNEEQAFLVCLDTRDGVEKWRVTREKAGSAWSSPLLWRNDKGLELIACGQQWLTSHDPQTGRELWRAGGLDMAGPSSLAADRGRVYFGFKSPVKKSSLYAMEAGAQGDQSLADGAKSFRCESWAALGAAPGMASPVVAGECVYVVNDNLLTCLAATSGQLRYKQRLPGCRCVVASPVVSGKHLVLVDESGSAVVVAIGPQYAIAGQAKLEDTFWASPAIADNTLILRGVDYLYGIHE